MGLCALALMVLSVCALPLGRIIVVPSGLAISVYVSLFFLTLAAYAKWRRLHPRMVNVFLMLFWAAVFSLVTLLPVVLLVRLGADPCDASLAKIDAALGMEVPTVLAFLGRFPALGTFSAFVYSMLVPLIVLALSLPTACGRLRAAKEFAVAALAALIISLPLFPLFPAVGPWHHYGFPPEAHQTVYAMKMTQEWYVVDSPLDCSLICAPSFHTILAILAAIALWPVRYLRWFAATLSSLIVISTVTTGTHYIIDVLAGLAVTAVAVALARGFTRLESRINPQPE